MLYKLIFFLLIALAHQLASAEVVRVGSKKFTENYILAEIMAQLLESKGFAVERNLGLGGTSIAFKALTEGSIDVYPEYTGTITQVLIKNHKNLDVEAINRQLRQHDVRLLPSFGFNNTYALAVNQSFAQEQNIQKISDLRGKEFLAAFSFEFIERNDGWGPLRDLYGLSLSTTAMEHVLAYEAVNDNRAQVMEVYTTDAKIEAMDLKVLEDDRGFFPQYLAAPLVRADLPAAVETALQELAGRLDEEKMVRLNAMAEIQSLSFAQVAQEFLVSEGLIKSRAQVAKRFDWGELAYLTWQHIYLTFAAVALAVLIAVPLGLLLFKFQSYAPSTMALAGLLQTIPSLALLTFMIPFFGIGTKPAIMALFLYSILPILRNTYVALKDIDPALLEAARGLGLYSWETLAFVQIPLGLPVILAGIRTAAVINVGMATVAAFIGAGGLGNYIVSGLSLNDVRLMLQGAIPAALLAVGVEVLFSVIEKFSSPR